MEKENTWKSDSWPCPASLLFMRRGDLISVSAPLFKILCQVSRTGMFFTTIIINLEASVDQNISHAVLCMHVSHDFVFITAN